MEEHDYKSHGSYDSDQWAVTIITYEDYYMVQRLMKVPNFWAVQRLPKEAKEALRKIAH
jgi:hypothetical protein